MKNIPLVVGNRVTYKDYETNKIKTIIIGNDEWINVLLAEEKRKDIKILKVEACLWETIEFVEE